jgi:hypothetical protein
MSRGQSKSRGRRMRGGQVIPPESSGFFDSALSFITSETKPLTDAAKQQKESLNTELKSVAEMSNAQGNSMFDSIKSFSPFGSSEEVTPVAQTQGPPINQSQGPPINQSQGPPIGGRRSSKSRSMRMKGGLNPAFGYYAAPVTDSVTAQPTYMMKSTGGKRRRSCKRRTCKRKSCRRKRSCKRRRSKRH